MILGLALKGLDRRARKEANFQLKHNSVVREYLYSPMVRGVRHLSSRVTVAAALIVYFGAHICVIGAQSVNDWYCRTYGAVFQAPEWFMTDGGSLGWLENLNAMLLSSQAALLGVLAVAIAIGTFLGSQQKIRVQIRAYFRDSFVGPLIKSVLALATVLCVQWYWPMVRLALSWGAIESPTLVLSIFSAVHSAWTIANFLVTAYFVASTLGFADPTARLKRLRTYYINDVHSALLSRRILNANCSNIGARLSSDLKISTFQIYRYGGAGRILVRAGNKRPRRVVDIWYVPLRLAFAMWARSAAPIAPASLSGSTPAVYIGVSVGDVLPVGAPIIRGTGVPKPSLLVRILLRLSFRSVVSK